MVGKFVLVRASELDAHRHLPVTCQVTGVIHCWLVPSARRDGGKVCAGRPDAPAATASRAVDQVGLGTTAVEPKGMRTADGGKVCAASFEARSSTPSALQPRRKTFLCFRYLPVEASCPGVRPPWPWGWIGDSKPRRDVLPSGRQHGGNLCAA